MKYQELLEGLSNIVYHATSVKNVVNILGNNSFRLTPDVGTDTEAGHRTKDSHVYYMSFTRSKQGQYHYPTIKAATGQCLIVLDGRKLMADGFTGRPVEYWGWHKEVKGPDGKSYKTAPAKDEMEDRLFSDKPEIPNASKYILEIHVLFDVSPEMRKPDQLTLMMDPNAPDEVVKRDVSRDDIYYRWIRKTYILSKKNDVPIFIYDDVKQFNLLNKNKARTALGDYTPTTPAKQAGGPSYRRKNPFGSYIEMLRINDRNKLSPDAMSKLSNMESWNRDDAIRSLAADVHNARTSDMRPKLDELIGEMKKLKIYNLKNLVEYIVDKFSYK